MKNVVKPAKSSKPPTLAPVPRMTDAEVRASSDAWHRQHLTYDHESEASAPALAAALASCETSTMVETNPARFAADALRWLADDMLLLSVAEDSSVGVNENILAMARVRLEHRVRALAEMVDRLADHGTLEPRASKEGGAA